jgi:hypothetical protein
MQRIKPSKRVLALAVAAAVAGAPGIACNRHDDRARDIPAPVDDTRSGPIEPQRKPVEPDSPRISTKTKLVVLAGAAALYYLYKRHQNAKHDGVDGQYYLSKNGRVYYRDAEHRAHWVTPPPGGIRVPESEAAQFRDFQGYDNQLTGRDLRDIASEEP